MIFNERETRSLLCVKKNKYETRNIEERKHIFHSGCINLEAKSS